MNSFKNLQDIRPISVGKTASDVAFFSATDSTSQSRYFLKVYPKHHLSVCQKEAVLSQEFQSAFQPFSCSVTKIAYVKKLLQSDDTHLTLVQDFLPGTPLSEWIESQKKSLRRNLKFYIKPFTFTRTPYPPFPLFTVIFSRVILCLMATH